MTKPPEPEVTGELKVTQADRDFHMWLTGTPLDEQDDETKQKVIRHRLTPRQDEVREGFQVEVGRWMLACFGEEIAADRIERADRFIEEALELAQTVPGFTVERARALVEYVFARPVGEMGQEVGGVGVTLAALCNTYAIDIAAEWERELARVWTKVDAIRAKQASKPVGFALPAALSDSSTREESGASTNAGDALREENERLRRGIDEGLATRFRSALRFAASHSVISSADEQSLIAALEGGVA